MTGIFVLWSPFCGPKGLHFLTPYHTCNLPQSSHKQDLNSPHRRVRQRQGLVQLPENILSPARHFTGSASREASGGKKWQKGIFLLVTVTQTGKTPQTQPHYDRSLFRRCKGVKDDGVSLIFLFIYKSGSEYKWNKYRRFDLCQPLSSPCLWVIFK